MVKQELYFDMCFTFPKINTAGSWYQGPELHCLIWFSSAGGVAKRRLIVSEYWKGTSLWAATCTLQALFKRSQQTFEQNFREFHVHLHCSTIQKLFSNPICCNNWQFYIYDPRAVDKIPTDNPAAQNTCVIHNVNNVVSMVARCTVLTGLQKHRTVAPL